MLINFLLFAHILTRRRPTCVNFDVSLQADVKLSESQLLGKLARLMNSKR